MTDDPIFEFDNGEREAAPASDRFADALALCNLVANVKVVKTRIRGLAKLNREIAAARGELERVQAQATGIVAKAESDVKAIHEDAQRRLDAAETAEQDIAQRERRIQTLEAAWRFIGEPQDVLSGFRSPEASPLAKARRAHGLPPGKDPDPLFFSEPDAAPVTRIDAMSDTSDDPHADRHGAPFLGELTRDVSHKRGRRAAGE